MNVFVNPIPVPSRSTFVQPHRPFPIISNGYGAQRKILDTPYILWFISCGITKYGIIILTSLLAIKNKGELTVMGKTKSTGTALTLSKNALTVLEKRYLKRDKHGKVLEKPEDMFRRVATAIASAETTFDADANVRDLAEKFYSMMVKFEFLPNSPTLMNAGRELGQLSACFVLPVGDSIDDIFDAVKYTALIHKSGGGTGFSFSRRRCGVVMSTTGISSGPISFMRVFDIATETIKQGGTRRGANMGILRVDHPDIMDFIMCKSDQKQLNNFNISVGLTEAFMKAVEKDEEYQLVNPRNGEPAGTLNAAKVFHRIVKQAWSNGEPGIVFLDRLNRDNPTPLSGRSSPPTPAASNRSCLAGILRPGLHQSGHDGHRRRIDWERLQGGGHSCSQIPRQCHRSELLPPAPDRRNDQGQQENRPGRHGLARHAHTPGYSLQFA